MSLTVREIMNPQLLYLREGDSVVGLRDKILRFGVSGAPVLDAWLRPVGFVLLRDFSVDGATITPAARALTVAATETVERAARLLASANEHHLVAVDGSGAAVGVVSALDVLRGLLGLQPSHPARFDVDCSSADAFADSP